MTRRLTPLFLLAVIANAASAAELLDEQTGLIVDSGWELVRAHCGGCHSHKIVTSQKADMQTWLDMIRWMQATQNLWQFYRSRNPRLSGQKLSAAGKQAAGADSAEPDAGAA